MFIGMKNERKNNNKKKQRRRKNLSQIILGELITELTQFFWYIGREIWSRFVVEVYYIRRENWSTGNKHRPTAIN